MENTVYTSIWETKAGEMPQVWGQAGLQEVSSQPQLTARPSLKKNPKGKMKDLTLKKCVNEVSATSVILSDSFLH